MQNEEIKSMNIFQRIRNVMLEVHYVQKEAKKVNGQYPYASHDAVTAKLHEPLARNGIVVVPTIKSCTFDSNRVLMTLEVSFINVDEPNDRFVTTCWGMGLDSSDKGIGKALSYAMKYAMLKTFCLETGDDVESDNYVDKNVSITAVQIFEIEKLLNGDNAARAGLIKWLKDKYEIPSIAAIPKDFFQVVIDTIIERQTKLKAKDVSKDQEPVS